MMQARGVGWRVFAAATSLAAVCSAQQPQQPQQRQVPGEPDPFVGEVQGYPVEERQVGTPLDVDADLARAFPKKGSVSEFQIPAGYFSWKEQLYQDTGIKTALNLTLIGQAASDSLNQNWLTGAPTEDVAAGYSVVLEAKWVAFNQERDWQGGVAAALDWRQSISGTAVPAFFALDTGSIWATDVTIIEWDPWLSSIYWEQWGEKDSFVARLGTQAAVQMFDFFRFKDGRSSFSNSEFWFPLSSMPLPGPGFGGSFEWWPVKNSPLYVVGTVNDTNFTVGESFAWDDAFNRGEFFYGLEVGYNWGEFPTNFDHLHAQVFFADEASAVPPGIPQEAGGGFKVRGSKQWGRWVGFGSYTYNQAKGGPFGLTLGEHAVTAGAAYLRPFDIRGEVGLGANWLKPFTRFDNSAPLFQGLSDQYGLEAYWKVLMFPDTWITPSVQMIFDPTFNPNESAIAIAGLKMHVFF